MVNIFGQDSVFGRAGNALVNQGRLGQVLGLGQYVANMYPTDKAYSGKLGVADTFPVGNEENPQGILNTAPDENTKTNNALAQQLNPYYPLIAPAEANMPDARPAPGSGIWRLLSLV